MRRKMSCVCALFFVAVFLVSFLAHAQSPNPQETLNQYISDLQKNPNDNALKRVISTRAAKSLFSSMPIIIFKKFLDIFT